jgi:hypothetical protein
MHTGRPKIFTKQLALNLDEDTLRMAKAIANDMFEGNVSQAIRYSVKFTYNKLYGNQSSHSTTSGESAPASM